MYRVRKDILAHEGQGHMGHVRGRSLPPPAAGNSNSWSSTRTLEGARLVRLQGMASHLGIVRSPFFPKNIGQYAAHLQETHAEKLRVQNERLQECIARSKLVDEWGKQFKYRKFLNGKVLEFKRVDAKASEIERVWPYGAQNQNEEAENQIGWPSTFEVKYDGEQRAKRGLKRQLPVPKRKVDEMTVTRLVNFGMAVEMAVELLYATEEEAGSMLKTALDNCGLDELSWKKTEAGLIEDEEKQREEWYTRYRETVSKELDDLILVEEVPLGGHQFDEAEMQNSGKWAEIFDELNKM